MCVEIRRGGRLQLHLFTHCSNYATSCSTISPSVSSSSPRFYTMFVPLRSVVHSGFAFCDSRHSVTPLPEHIGFGGSVALTVGRRIVGIAIRMQSRVYFLSTTDIFPCLHDIHANCSPMKPTKQIIPDLGMWPGLKTGFYFSRIGRQKCA